MNNIEKLYRELRLKYGKPEGQWKLWCKRPKADFEREEVIFGAILTQRTNWKNVELALGNLKEARVNSFKSINRLEARGLAPLIKPSGFYRTKADYLISLVRFILKDYGSLTLLINNEDFKKLREKLLGLKGVGLETADSILLYALDKPVFVIDEYTKRLVAKRNLSDNLSYSHLQELFQKSLRKDFRLYQDFHALIVIDGKNK